MSRDSGYGQPPGVPIKDEVSGVSAGDAVPTSSIETTPESGEFNAHSSRAATDSDADYQISDIARKLLKFEAPQRRRRSSERPQSFASSPSRHPLSRLVGRDEELASISSLIAESADAKRLCLLTVVGNQGTGKSRLVDEALLQLADTTLVCRCNAARDGGRYSTIARLLRDRFGICESIPKAQAMHEFHGEVQAVFREQMVSDFLHVLGRFLDFDFPGSPFVRLLSEDPIQSDAVSRAVWRRLVTVDASTGPLVLVVDELHWADEDSVRMLEELLKAVESADVPVTIVVCARPEFFVRVPEWGKDVKSSLRVELRNLDVVNTKTVLREMLNRCGAIPNDIVENAVLMTGGNPQFIEQLFRTYMANGTIDAESTPWSFDPKLAIETVLPISVEEIVGARVSSLGVTERELLEKGAVFGNVFLLQAVVALSRQETSVIETMDETLAPAGPHEYAWSMSDDKTSRHVSDTIASLVERDYLLRVDDGDHGSWDGAELAFKHNLERDLVSASTDATKSKRYYRAAAQWLETTSGVRTEEEMEYLGTLYENAGDHRSSARAYLAGGDLARQRHANEQAVSLYRRCLALLAEDDAVVRLEALHNIGSALDFMGETDEAQELFSQMLKHSWLLNHRAKGGAAHGRLSRIYRHWGHYDLAMTHLRSAHDLFETVDDKRGVAGTLDDIGQIHWLRGAYGQALRFHRQALAIRRGLGDTRSIALSLANVGRVHHETGGFQAASRQFKEALNLRREINDESGIIQSLCDMGRVEISDGNFAQGQEMFADAEKLALEIGDRLALTNVLTGLGTCQAFMGEYSDAIDSLLRGKSVAESLGNRSGTAHCYHHLAEACLLAGDVAGAYENAERALDLGRDIGARLQIGRAHRVLAESLFSGERGADEVLSADEHFRKSVEILAGMKSELELARTYRSYSKLREYLGNNEESEKLRRCADDIFGRLQTANQSQPLDWQTDARETSVESARPSVMSDLQE